MNYIGNKLRPGVSLGVLGYPGVSWGNQTDPFDRFSTHKRSINLAFYDFDFSFTSTANNGGQNV